MDPKENPSLWNNHVAPLDQRAARRSLSQSVVKSQKSSTMDTTVKKTAFKPNTRSVPAYSAEMHKALCDFAKGLFLSGI